jgi:O-antigen/teichoic acid export membrane protein
MMILFEAPLYAFGALASVEALLVAVTLAMVYRRHPSAERWANNGKIARDLLLQCWPLIASSLAGAAYLRADQVLIRNTLDNSALGLYAAALQISQVHYVVPVVLVATLGPLVAHWHAAQPSTYEHRVVIVFRLFFFTGLLLSALIAATARPLVSLLFGSTYEAAAGILIIHAFCGPFVFLGSAHNLWLWNSGKLRVRLVGTLLAGAFSITFNVLLLGHYGLQAAAWIAIGSQIIATFAINAVLAPRSFLLQLVAIFFLPTSILQTSK